MFNVRRKTINKILFSCKDNGCNLASSPIIKEKRELGIKHTIYKTVLIVAPFYFILLLIMLIWG